MWIQVWLEGRKVWQAARRGGWALIAVGVMLLGHGAAQPARAQEVNPRLALRGQLAGPANSWNSPLVARGDVIFVFSGAWVQAIDVRDASSPRVIGEVVVVPGLVGETGRIHGVRGLAIDGDRLVAVTGGSLIVLDAADPTQLGIVGRWSVTEAAPKAPGEAPLTSLVGPIVVHDGVAYVAGSGGFEYRGWTDGMIVAIDVRDSAGPLLQSVTSLGLKSGWGVGAMSREGNDLWLALHFTGQMGATGNGGVQRWDISVPARPMLLQNAVAPRTNNAKTPPRWYEAYAIAAQDGLVALGTMVPRAVHIQQDQSGQGGLRLLSPAPRGHVDILPAGHWNVDTDISGLAWHGNRLFVATEADHMGFKDGPGRILLLGQRIGSTWQPEAELAWERSIRSLVKDGQRIYAVDSAGTLLVLETSLPEEGHPWATDTFLPRLTR